MRGVLEWMVRRPGTRTLAYGALMGRPEQVPSAAALEASRNLAASAAFTNTVATITRDRSATRLMFTASTKAVAPS